MDISGLLQDVLVTVADTVSVKGQPCLCHSKILEGYVSPYDATVVARLREAGAVITGCVNDDTLNVSRDTGGDICHKATLWGRVGLKPSYGRVSRYGMLPYASSMNQVGAIDKTVKDVAVLLQVMAGHDPLDGMTADVPVPDYGKALQGGMKGLRIGVPKEYFSVDAEIVRKSIDGCAKAGAEVVEVSLPHTEYALAVYTIISAAEASTNLACLDGVRYGHRTKAHVNSAADLFSKSRGEGFDVDMKRDIILGTYLLSKECYEEYFVRAQKVRTLIRRDFEEAFKVCDVMMAPVTFSAFPALSLAGICGLSVPCGKTQEGEPLGLQILGPAFGEERILRAAYAYEQEVRA